MTKDELEAVARDGARAMHAGTQDRYAVVAIVLAADAPETTFAFASDVAPAALVGPLRAVLADIASGRTPTRTEAPRVAAPDPAAAAVERLVSAMQEWRVFRHAFEALDDATDGALRASWAEIVRGAYEKG